MGGLLLRLLNRNLTDGGALLVGHVLAFDGLVLHLHVVVHLERGDGLQRLFGKLVVFVASALGQEVDLHALDHLVGVEARDGGGALTGDARREGAQSVELHRNALRHHLTQTADDVLQHQHCEVVLHQRTVLGDVLGETLKVQSAALEDARVVHTVTLRLGVVVLVESTSMGISFATAIILMSN